MSEILFQVRIKYGAEGVVWPVYRNEGKYLNRK